MASGALERPLTTAELWAAGQPANGLRPSLVAGWEDGYPFCAAVCTTNVGLQFCRRCPEAVVGRVLATGRPASGRCPAGVRLVAFPAPRGVRGRVGVLRVAPPAPRTAAAISETVRVAPAVLRRAARTAPTGGRAILGAARTLRDPAGLEHWQAHQRDLGADRRRTATAALAQMIAISEELHELYRSAQRQSRELARSQRRLDRLARKSLLASDRERALIAHQIHDTAAQSLVSAFRFLEAARASSIGRPEEAAAHLALASERLVSAIGELRGVLARLVPPGLAELGLRTAIDHRLAGLTAGGATTGRVRGDLPRLPEWVEQALFGMTGEAISNAVRHGRPSTIDVELGVRGRRAVITVTDDGAGFDPAAVRERTDAGGLGLEGLARQAGWLGGVAAVDSHRGHGTRVRVSIPLTGHLTTQPTAGDERAPGGPAGDVSSVATAGRARAMEGR